jgi:pimeloyl-ACP methyl ester carboxylesterase
VSEGFSTWDIRPMIKTIDCPTLVLQGTEDEYATPGHVASTVDAIGSNAEGRLLDGLRHNLHHDAPDLVIDTVVEFLSKRATG